MGTRRTVCAARQRWVQRRWVLCFLPFFQAQAVLSAQQGSFTPLFAVQLVLEIIALIAAVVSYIWMVRYLWRARRLLAEEGKA